MPHHSRSPSTGVAARWLGRWRAVPPLVRAATGGFVALMVAMLYLYPAYYGVDEAGHFDMAYAYSMGDGIYAPGTRWVANGVLRPEYGQPHGAFIGAPPRTSFAETPAVPRSQRPTLEQAGGDTPSKVSDQMTQHPPLYYLFGAAVLDVPGVSGLAYDWQFALLRLLSLAFMIPLPWLFWRTARALGAADLAPAASLVPLLAPAFARTGASVTNDSLLILCFGAATYLLARVVTGDNSRRTGIWLAVWIALALLTKGFALELPLIAALAYLVCWRRHQVRVRAPVVTVACGAILGGLWWAHNLLAYGTVQPSGYPPGYNDVVFKQLAQGHGHLRGFLTTFARLMTKRFWGSLGILEPPWANTAFAVAATLVLLLLALVGVLWGLRGRWGSAAALVLALPFLLTLILLLAGSWPDWAEFKVPAGMQGRYLFPAFAGLTAVAFVGLSRLVRGRARRLVAPAVFVAAAYTEVWSFRQVLQEWWEPRDGTSGWAAFRAALRALVSWAPWPAAASAVLGLVIVALVLWLVWMTAVSVVRPGELPSGAGALGGASDGRADTRVSEPA